MAKESVIDGQRDIVNHVINLDLGFRTLLDIGVGNGYAAREFSKAGYQVTATGFDIEKYTSSDVLADDGVALVEAIDICDMGVFPQNSFDAVWCSHVLEHVLNTGQALAEVRRVLRPEGYLFVSVPPFKHNIVGGHVKPGWNIGTLLYVLAVCGFDTKNGSFIRHGYNVCALVQTLANPEGLQQLKYASGDLEQLAEMGYAPPGLELKQNMEGNLSNINWHWSIPRPDKTSNRGTATRSDNFGLPRLVPAPPTKDVSLLKLLKSMGDSIPGHSYNQRREREFTRSVLPRDGQYTVLDVSVSAIAFPQQVADYNRSISCQHHDMLGGDDPVAGSPVEPHGTGSPPATRLPFSDSTFDYVYSHRTFNQLLTPVDNLREIYRVMQAGGTFFGVLSSLEPSHHQSFVHYTPLGWNRLLQDCDFIPGEITAGIDGLSAILHRLQIENLKLGRPFTYSALNIAIDQTASPPAASNKLRNLMKVVYAGRFFFTATKQ